MEPLITANSFSALWQACHAVPNLSLLVNMVVALFLGFLFGYERSYHGRAAGMRTYGLVCMVSSVLTAISAQPALWLGGGSEINSAIIDPTRTIQGIVTGVGFLGAGIIMKDGFRISGLTTAASIWASAAIGVLVGLDFYGSALAMTLLAEVFVLLGSRFDIILPSRRPIFVSLQFKKEVHPREDMIREITSQNGYEVAQNSIAINLREGRIEWQFVAISINRRRNIGISNLADVLAKIEGVESFHLSRARN